MHWLPLSCRNVIEFCYVNYLIKKKITIEHVFPDLFGSVFYLKSLQILSIQQKIPGNFGTQKGPDILSVDEVVSSVEP